MEQTERQTTRMEASNVPNGGAKRTEWRRQTNEYMDISSKKTCTTCTGYWKSVGYSLVAACFPALKPALENLKAPLMCCNSRENFGKRRRVFDKKRQFTSKRRRVLAVQE